ncbi:MAG: DUF6485 family protein [Defluviitaleaceae bacterium]|nr:DUF6485 family protein [Defluviitaleaceae bacterium]
MPTNGKGCDSCIQKNLKQGEIPACFFLSVSDDVDGLTEFSVESFVAFYLKHKGMPGIQKCRHYGQHFSVG